MVKTYTEQLEDASFKLLQELLPSHLLGEVKIDDLNIFTADVERLKRMRELASEFSKACARRAAELLDLEDLERMDENA